MIRPVQYSDNLKISSGVTTPDSEVLICFLIVYDSHTK